MSRLGFELATSGFTDGLTTELPATGTDKLLHFPEMSHVKESLKVSLKSAIILIYFITLVEVQNFSTAKVLCKKDTLD